MQQSLLLMDLDVDNQSVEDLEMTDIDPVEVTEVDQTTLALESSKYVDCDSHNDFNDKNDSDKKNSWKSLIPIALLVLIIIAGIVAFFVSGHNIIDHIFYYANKVDLGNSLHLGICFGCLIGAMLSNMFAPVRNIIAVVIGFLAQKSISNFYLAAFVGLVIDIPSILAVTCLQWALTQLWLKKRLQRMFENSKAYRATMLVIDCIPTKCQILIRMMTPNGVGGWICSSMEVSFKSYLNAASVIIPMTSLLFVPFGAGLGKISQDLDADAYDGGSVFNMKTLWENHKTMVIMFIVYFIVLIIVLRSIIIIVKQKVNETRQGKETGRSQVTGSSEHQDIQQQVSNIQKASEFV